MAKANRQKAGKRRNASKRFLALLLLLLLVVIGAGAYLYLQKGGQPTVPKRPAAKEVKKTRPALPAASRPQAGRRQPSPPPAAEPAAKAAQPQAVRTYRVRPGECLWKIAGLAQVYGDPRLWEILYLANPQAMDYAYSREQAPYVILEPGVILTVPEPAQVKELLNAQPGSTLWVIQVSSNLELAYALSLAARLKAIGLHVYILEDSSGYPTWYLVRLGFFSSKAKATAEEILRKSGLKDYLLRPASGSELRRYLPFHERARK